MIICIPNKISVQQFSDMLESIAVLGVTQCHLMAFFRTAWYATSLTYSSFSFLTGAIIGHSVWWWLAQMLFQTRALAPTSTWRSSMTVSPTVSPFLIAL